MQSPEPMSLPSEAQRPSRDIPLPSPARSRSDDVEIQSTRDVGVVIVAGGSGTRTGGSELKQFRWVAGKPALLHSVQAFMARDDVAIVVVVLPKAYAADPPPWLFQCDVERLLVSTGGAERHESVVNGLEDLPEHVTIAVVHDAARPLVTDDTIARVIAEARKGHGAIAALPVVDTLMEVDADGRIVRYDKKDRTPAMLHIDYGLSIFTSATFAGRPEAFDLSEIQRDLVIAGKMAGFESSHRFYEIGSHSGLAELEAVLAQSLKPL